MDFAHFTLGTKFSILINLKSVMIAYWRVKWFGADHSTNTKWQRILVPINWLILFAHDSVVKFKLGPCIYRDIHNALENNSVVP